MRRNVQAGSLKVQGATQALSLIKGGNNFGRDVDTYLGPSLLERLDGLLSTAPLFPTVYRICGRRLHFLLPFLHTIHLLRA